VISLQNGLYGERIAKRLGPKRTAATLGNLSADYLGPGRIRFGGTGDYFFGMVDRSANSRLEELAALLQPCMDAVVTDNIAGYLWAKECYGCLLVATALVDAPIHETVQSPPQRRVIFAALREAFTVADACGIRLESFFPFDPDTFRHPVDMADQAAFFSRVADRYRNQAKQHSGIWRDLRVRHRRTEVPWLTGELVHRADLLGVPVPVNRRIVEMIREIENDQRGTSEQNFLELAVLL
jgi:2-dehydropantoate 2-reductase